MGALFSSLTTPPYIPGNCLDCGKSMMCKLDHTVNSGDAIYAYYYAHCGCKEKQEPQLQSNQKDNFEYKKNQKLQQIVEKKIGNNTIPKSLCAKYVREIIEELHQIEIERPKSIQAKDYGQGLIKAGYKIVPSSNYIPQDGDVRIYQPHKGKLEDGHMQIYYNGNWYSDYKQPSEFPRNSYKVDKEYGTTYRY